MERIYIGGLDPPRLTAEEVASRIESSFPQVEIRSKHVVPGRNYFHVEAVLKVQEDSDSALGIIAKQYHNVTWKRCKLVVQAARPHFLERLQQEREERKQVQEEETVGTRQKIPRHLRIRQKYGQEAHHVDTKPCCTQDYPTFCHVVNKMRARRQKYMEKAAAATREKKQVLEKPKAFMNRAVHLQWNEAEVNVLPLGGDKQEELVATASDGTSASEQSEIDSEEDSSILEPETDQKAHSAYVWSDESSDDSSVDSEKEHGEKSNDVVSSESEDASSESDVGDNDIQPPDRKTTTQYQWSSDEEEVVLDKSTSLGSSAAKPTMDEFSAAIDFDDTSAEEEEATPLSSKDNTSVDLGEDVKANLAVLSELFPGMGIPTTESVNERADTKPSAPLMERFDPSKESAKKYIIEPTAAPSDGDQEENDSSSIEDEESSDESEGEVEGTPDASVSTDQEEDQANEGEKTTVYEQNKLEDIFREARAAEGSGGGFKLSSMFDNKVQEEGDVVTRETRSAQPFAFGFDLSTKAFPTEQASKQREGLAFSFDVGDKASEAPLQSEKSSGSASYHEKSSGHDSEDGNKKDEAVSAGICRRGLSFPDHVLQDYTDAFFAMNEGPRILEDAEAFLYDDDVKREWMKERQALTLDWKRKKKYAQSRMQKKMKFR